MKPTTEPVLDVITVRIKACLVDIAKNVIEIGRQLKAAKSLVAHGAWQNWLESNFNLSVRSAQNYMRVAEHFGKNENVFVFQPAQMLELTKIPVADTEIFLAQLKAAGIPAESLSVRALREAIKKWNTTHHKPRKSSTAEPVITIDAGEIATTTTAVVPARLVQLTLFDVPTPLTTPKFLLPAEIVTAAKTMSTPCYLVTRAGHVDFSTPSIVVAMATPLATWLQPLVSKAAALIHCKQNFPTDDGGWKLKTATILYFGDDVHTFAVAFRFFGSALIPLKVKLPATCEPERTHDKT